MIETRGLTHRYGDDRDAGTATGDGEVPTDSGSDDAAGGETDDARPAAVRDVSITIPDGEFIVLAGANGSGKSTLVRHFNGLLTPDEGTVRVDGTPVGDDLVAARTRVGMVFQEPRDCFVAATVGRDVAFGPENLGLDRAEIDRRVREALAAVNMAGRGDERIDRLSGGEQERVAVAGALAMEPAHLVLDEPFTGLDEPSRRAVLDRLRALHSDGTGVVLVTHDLRDVLDPADRVVVLSNGSVAVDAPPAEALEALEGLAVRAPD
ncbi:energy-coupling factor ABC transporter ATP-binding protein [Halobaculum sp. CBA1158]|uniref:energy-coupling factor ABC transporter ATP-binding protein n=1 Tax=Halobaculum sp. CBA1158 TaxID=2904243 RepID=UPI001F350AF5|nr:ABC transporter ATP-binding protein [Halobaculum sp. CBA1158]UIO98710.1 energy-coupling factor ABC transporter ATP-binding protein [Halobaculum sp. CBA1158]